MRVLLTGLPIFSHIVPALVPVARALQAQGHDVAVASGASVAEVVRSAGIRFVELAGIGSHAELAEGSELAELARLTTIPHPATLVGRGYPPADADRDFQLMFLGPLARLSTAGILAAARPWRPDLVVSESLEYGGYLAAASLGVPHAVLDTAPLMTLTHPAIPDWLDDLRVARGLPPAQGQSRHGGLFRAGLLPRCWYPTSLDGPSLRVYQPPEKAPSTPVEPLPGRRPGEPFVLATMGSVAPDLLNGHRRIFEALLTALGRVGCPAVVALGSKQALAAWTGDRPPNVRLTDFAPQRSLLSMSSVFVTHAGFSGVREALLAGVPMITVPLFGDQQPNAARVTELGAGLDHCVTSISTQTLTAGLRRVLDEPSFRTAAQEIRRLSRDLPGFDQLASDLADLAR
jgi:UDP:flavonoid glycosyltransferase YjiC (YdhE family)